MDGCRELESFKLYGYSESKICKKAFIRLAELPKLTRLVYKDVHSVNNFALAEFSKGPAPLRRMCLSGCDKIGDRGVAHILRRFDLVELEVRECWKISQEMKIQMKEIYNL